MAYSKTTWATGDVITAAKLNNIEDGVAANDTAISGIGIYAVEGTFGEDDTLTLNKKAGDLYTAIAGNKLVKIASEISEGIIGEYLLSIAALKLDNEGTVTYSFRLVMHDGDAYSVENLAATDDVVLTLET